MENLTYAAGESVGDAFRRSISLVYHEMDWQKFGSEVVSSELLYLSLFFVVAKPMLPRLPEHIRKAYLNPFLKVYNLAMSLYSLLSFLVIAKALTEVPLRTNDCGLAFRHDMFRLSSQLFYYSKFVEYIDSFSLVLAGKPVSFLQSFHHFGAPIMMWVLVHPGNESVWIMVLMNSFVHFIMYAYYFFSLMKIRFPGKVLITVMQVTQFLTGFYLVYDYKDIPCFRASPWHVLGWLYSYGYVFVVLTLFLNFSLWTYVFPKKRKLE